MLSSCMEHILTKDALYLLSYISTWRDNDGILPHRKEKCKHKFWNFENFLRNSVFTLAEIL